MAIKNFKTAEEIRKEISGYERKLDALDDRQLSIKLVVEQNVLMTIGATVENETFYGVLAVDLVENISKNLRAEIMRLEAQLAEIENFGYSACHNIRKTGSLQYGLKRNQESNLKGVFRNIMNFFSLF